MSSEQEFQHIINGQCKGDLSSFVCYYSEELDLCQYKW